MLYPNKNNQIYKNQDARTQAEKKKPASFFGAYVVILDINITQSSTSIATIIYSHT